MLSQTPDRYRRYRAPTGNDSALIEPPLAQLRGEPREQANEVELLGKRLGKLRSEARQELLAAASAYTGSYRELPTLATDAIGRPFFLTGHQAELFHPGVWFKNFVMSRLASERRGIGIHLVIDSDVSHAASLRVPTGTMDEPRVESIAFDRPSPPVPVEMRQVIERSFFESFAGRVQQAIAPLLPDPLVGKLWPMVLEATDRTGGNLGLAFAQARHLMEMEWLESRPSASRCNLSTLEIPMSHCCEMPAFRWFLCHLLEGAPRLHEAYNGALAAYREAHHLRNSAQPMPNLSQHGDEYETPFWIWTTEKPERRALFARRSGEQVELSNRHGWSTTIDLAADRSAETAVGQLEELSKQGVCIRTRALTTTLFARMVLGDFFLHGIGGAKYDEVTNDLSERLFGLAPPPFLTLSATLHLPIQHRRGSADDLREVRHTAREMKYHPETFVPADADAPTLAIVEEKRQSIALPKTPENAAERHGRILHANKRLQPAIQAKRRRLESREERMERNVRAAAILESREYSFCLYPEDDLRERMLRLVGEKGEPES